MFWELLCLTAGLSISGVAVMEGKGAGMAGVLVGLLIGIPAGVVFWGTSRKTMKWIIIRHLLPYEESAGRLALEYSLIVTLFVLMGSIGIFVGWVTRFVVRQL